MNTLINKTKLHMAASALAIAAMVLSLVPMQAFAQGAGAIWTTTGSCGTPQNINSYQIGEQVFINGSGFGPDTFPWSIQGQPGGASADPNATVASGNITVDGTGNFCFPAYTIAADDDGVYNVQVGNKKDNYSVDGVTTGTLTVTKVISGIQGIAANLFGYSINGGTATAFQADGSNDETVNLGTYSVVESGVTNGQVTVGQNTYNVSYSVGCNGTLTTTPALCTITNTYVPPTPTLCTDTTANNVGQPLPCTYTDLCPNVPGNQTDTTLCPTTPTTCTVVITSDTADYVLEKAANAQILSFIHGNWTSGLGSASWIWGDNPVVDPSINETQTFRKQFGFVGTVTSATLEVASDNTHTATLNAGAANAGGSTFSAPVSYNVTGDVVQGNNTLTIGVTNTGVLGSSVTTNPAGLKYRLTIQGTPTTDADCSVPFVVDVCPNLGGVQASVPAGQVIVNNQCVPIVNGCTNPDATNFNQSATPGNPQAAVCDFNYVSACSATSTNLLTNGSFELPGLPNNNSWANLDTVIGWTYDFGPGLEVWRGLSGFLASDGLHHVELDGNASTTISQTITTIPGATYELRFDFAARSGTAAANNAVLATANATTVVNATTGNTNWTTYGNTFVAGTNSTVIALADAGTPVDSYGTLIDDVYLCLVREPNNGGGGNNDIFGCTDEEASNYNPRATKDDESCVYDAELYRIYGYVWHDNNRNEEWDGIDDEESGNEEDDLEGWTVRITNGTASYSTTTDADGYYYFDVPAGTWTITEDVEGGWLRTTQESFVVTVPQLPPPPPEPEENISAMIMNFFIPTAHAQVPTPTTYGPYDFGNDRRSGGGGGGTRVDNDPDGEVLGDSDSPKPLVLGEQTSAVPTGAPNTGKGGTATVVLGQFLTLPRRRN